MRRVVQSAQQRTESTSPPGETINISDPTNIVVAGTSGDAGAVHKTSSRQTVRVRQNGAETYESETAETETRSS